MAGIFDFLAAVGRALWGVWTLDYSMPVWLNSRPDAFRICVTVAIIAGASTLLGNSAVLFLNRVRGLRFVFSLVLNGLAMAGLYALQAVVVWVLGPLVIGRTQEWSLVFRGVMLSTAPLAFGVFALAPYVGPAIARLLQAWGAVVLWMIVRGLYDVGLWPALAVTLGAWGVMQLASWAFAKPVAAIGNRVWRLVSGRPLMLTGQDLLSGQPFLPLAQQFEGQEVR